MGIEKFNRDPLPVDEDISVAQLIDRYGYEAVRRGLEYTMSLSEADEEYRKSANTENLESRIREAFNVPEDEDIDTEAIEKWQEAMENEGIGIEE